MATFKSTSEIAYSYLSSALDVRVQSLLAWGTEHGARLDVGSERGEGDGGREVGSLSTARRRHAVEPDLSAPVGGGPP
jgi:hypothetical protein